MTDLRSSQNALEAWVQNLPAVRTSQVAGEVWMRQIPVTAVVVSQALVEVWVPSLVTAPGYRRERLSAQVV
jgi:hypothetical protein